MKRIASALWADPGPFYLLNGVADIKAVYTPEELQPNDILIIHGGGDISPSLYNKKASKKNGATEQLSRRDSQEWALLQAALAKKIPIIGICRGGQMLCAAMGGFLYQHIEGHARNGHEVVTDDHQVFRTNSLHHQMMVPNKNSNYVLKAKMKHATCFGAWDEDTVVSPEVETEYLYYPDVKGHAIQWHPEMMDDNATANKYLLSFMNATL